MFTSNFIDAFTNRKLQKVLFELVTKYIVLRVCGVLKGPALYGFNDALFTESDWTGIRMLQDSIKENDTTKIGRFGLGFKSVFHITGTIHRFLFLDDKNEYVSTYLFEFKGEYNC